MSIRLLISIFLLSVVLPPPAVAQELYDVVILGGRVMDPETGRDEIANVGIRGDTIRAITVDDIRGRKTIDASGQIVAPGFIDILASIRQDKAAHEFKIGDGVTTVLGMHGGPIDVTEYSRRHAAVGPLVNFGATVSHVELREAVGATDRYAPATPKQIEAMRPLAVQAIRDGAVGIGFGINYTPGASYEEIFALFEVAAAEGVPCHLHARYKGNVFPLTMSLATMEVVSIAAATGAQAQLAHLISSTVGSAPLSIALIEGAAARGVDVGFDFHVWTRNQTRLQSALFDEGWQERFGGATYSDIYVADTQERLTEARFFELRAQPGALSVQTEFIPEEEMIMGLESPLGIVSSDGGGLVDGRGHPRSVGTFARFLGRFVRELEVVDWMDGIAKITLLPAERLEQSVPAMSRKGRLQIGMDADVTVFDPATVQERATYAEPAQMSAGISFVIVNGMLVLDDGEIVEGAESGEWLRHPRPVP
ncbi:MAG: D-glutamate deacylase [Gammaproteobacteria bacterium]|jgi:dihydroorotase|nr:D-glutamate deacylase [Gammaproteobacteria bacterium]